MQSRHILAVGALVLASFPARAQGLGLVEGLFDEVSAVTIFYQGGLVPFSDEVTTDGGMLHGGGTEVLINLKSGGGISYELGLGASYLRGYQAEEPSLDLRASLRALPTVSLYTTWESEPVSRYLGLGFGLVELWDAQAYGPSGQPWDVEANAFEVVLSGGFYLEETFAEGLFVEGGYRFRNFHSVKWTATDDADALPASWPRSLDFSGPFLSLGWQLQLDQDEDDDREAGITPPAPAGVWTLERMDARALPVVLDSTSAEWTTVVHGVLRLEAGDESAGSYTLDLNVRQHPRTNESPVAMVREVGSYTSSETAAARTHVLTLVPTNAPERIRSAERLAGRLYLTWNGHVLVFAPGDAR
ncbi:MAG TPA: hypothetical protein VEQ60_26255 [Longimicrobium sp.]|nr:hypothetical protein [Longimicrobium sp.]